MKAVIALLSVCLLITASCTNSKLESDLKTANSTIQLLRTQANSSNNEIQSLRNQLNDANTTVQSLLLQATTGNTTIKSLQTLLNSAQTQVNTLNGTVQTMQQQLNTNNTTMRLYQTQLNAANSQIGTLQDQLSTANASIQNLVSQFSAANISANATIQSLLAQLGVEKAAANTTIVSLQGQLAAANTQITHLNDTITGLSRVAPSSASAILVDYDYLYNQAQNNEVALNYFYRYCLVQMSHLKVVKIYDTNAASGLKADLMSTANLSVSLVFKSAIGLEKLAPNMTITVYGTCNGAVGGIPMFGPDFVLVQIDSIP
jgi:predicted  nucleic acid-binding Zn-ribbon protein